MAAIASAVCTDASPLTGMEGRGAEVEAAAIVPYIEDGCDPGSSMQTDGTGEQLAPTGHWCAR